MKELQDIRALIEADAGQGTPDIPGRKRELTDGGKITAALGD